MKSKTIIPLVGALLASRFNSSSQPTISSVTLSGQSATSYDSPHSYLSNSVSPGANVTFAASVSGALRYQWRFNQIDLLGQTNRTLVFPSVQPTNAGDYTLVVTNAAGTNSRVVTLAVDPTFTKITTGPIVTDVGFSPGGTWGDINNDGLLDLFVFNGMDGNSYRSFLYQNNGGTTFTKITNGSPVSAMAESYSACWGDYDNDGNLDLLVTGVGKIMLYRNNGNGTFLQITNSGVIPDPGAWPCASWADYDNDGLLDLLLANYNGGAPAHPYLFHNNGDGTFTKVASGSIASDLVVADGCGWADYDNDGYPDLFVCNLYGANRLYHNNGDGTFTKTTTGGIVTDAGFNSINCAWGDYDNDGFLDLFVANVNGHNNYLYHNDGDGTFTRITNGIVVTDAANGANGSGSIGCAWGDYDNDGWLDLYVGNEGNTDLVPTVVNFLYHNNGDGTFTKVTTGSPVNEYSDSWGVSWVDYDNDGFLDLFASRGDGRGNYLYRNNGNSNSWLTVKLAGTASNRAAIGAKVRVKATISGVSRWQLRQITGGGGFAGHNELRANFGLGDATNIDQVRIEWPSGIVQTLTNPAPNQIMTVVEHQDLGVGITPQFTGVARSPDGSVSLSATGDTHLLYVFEASTNLVNWTKVGVRSNATGNVGFTDLNARNFANRFYRVSVP